MSRDLEAEMDALRGEMRMLTELAQRLAAKEEKSGKRTEGGEAAQDMPPGKKPVDPRIARLMEKNGISFSDKTGGALTYYGAYSALGRGFLWARDDVNAENLFALIENGSAEKVLKCIGSNERLRMLLALIKKPMTVSELIESSGYNTTGQVYHHLKPLIAADLVSEEASGERGRYAARPYRVHGVIMLLAGISDLLDDKYSAGTWEEDAT